ncbi:MAG TPA: hemagglutinin repeat-containing protein [Desulfovibrio sp.]|uniref:hemagglutinin repeat-containing protein n=1 Tax=Desulfovibrio sp. TaxID=885 RepID=UPI002D355673|nr:hemagglutinin repeat-containing protein [Desulfovibrio sp.]HZF60377.1 hemagglutinin repeat-containing protein [Desulfovibrio sp.]
MKGPPCSPRVRCGRSRRLTRGNALRLAASTRCCKNSPTPNQQNVKLVVGEKLTTVSGQIASVAGGNLTGKDVDMHVSRNLNVSSVQNSSSFNSSFNVGAEATVAMGQMSK